MFNAFLKTTAFAALLSGGFAAPAPQLVARQQTPNDGFPDPNAQQLMTIETTAQGTIPNGPLPPPGAFPADSITNFQLIQYNENFEVAFFTSLLNNVTSKAHGFKIHGKKYDYVVEVLKSVIAQEEIHSITAGAILKSQNQSALTPCKYAFPTSTFEDAIALAATFTDVVLGTLQDVIQILGEDGLSPVARQIAGVVGQEGEQNGLYRVIQKKIPSANPFLTTSARDFAWTALQSFTVPGSCPQDVLSMVKLHVFGALNLLTAKPAPKDQILEFSFDLNSLKMANLPVTANWTAQTDFANEASVVYINQQNVPIVTPLTDIQVSGTVVKFCAEFPFSKESLYGLTIAAVTLGKGPFADAPSVAKATVFGPGLIEID